MSFCPELCCFNHPQPKSIRKLYGNNLLPLVSQRFGQGDAHHRAAAGLRTAQPSLSEAAQQLQAAAPAALQGAEGGVEAEEVGLEVELLHVLHLKANQ